MIKGIATEPLKATPKLEQEFEKLGEKLVENQVKIVLLILEDEKITKNRITEILNISNTAVDKNIFKLKNLGLIKRVGPAKGGHWEVLSYK